MTNILQKQRGAVYSANAVFNGSGSQQRHRSHMMTTQTNEMVLQPLSAGQKRSLNREARKRELMKITKENQLILKRLQDKSANYNVSKWQKEEDSRKRLLKNICEYPYVSGDSRERFPVSQPDFIIKKKKTSSSATQGGFYNKKKGYTKTDSYQNAIIKKETLYRGQRDLGNGSYEIEMLLSQQDDLVISAQHMELPDSFIIEIENKKVEHLILEFENNFDYMADHLKIMNKRMVLLNPVSVFNL